MAALKFLSGHSKLVHWDNPKGWDGKEVGEEFEIGDTCTPVTDSYQCMAETTTIL